MPSCTWNQRICSEGTSRARPFFRQTILRSGFVASPVARRMLSRSFSFSAEREQSLLERSIATDKRSGSTQHLEALEPGHFYVEKQQIRPELFDLLNRLEAILSLADHSNLGMSAEQPDQPRASIRLIINDQAPHHAAAPLSRGNRIVTRVPPACRTSIVIRPWS